MVDFAKELPNSLSFSQSGFIWPRSFVENSIAGRSDAELCADGLEAWGIVMTGERQHENFGMILAKIGIRLGCSATADGLMEKSKEYVA